MPAISEGSPWPRCWSLGRNQFQHFEALAAAACSGYARSIDIRRAHNAAASVGHLLGRGIYGVDRHLPKPEVLQRVSDEAEDIVASGPPGRQWHASEILSALVERDSSDFSGEAINKYIVDIALRKSGDLKAAGPNDLEGNRYQ